MGTGVSVSQDASLSKSKSTLRLKDSILLKSIRYVDFTNAPKELQQQQDQRSSSPTTTAADGYAYYEGGEPQWALMSALLERHTVQLELRKKYDRLEDDLDKLYDEEDKKDLEFLNALVAVDEKTKVCALYSVCLRMIGTHQRHCFHFSLNNIICRTKMLKRKRRTSSKMPRRKRT